MLWVLINLVTCSKLRLIAFGLLVGLKTLARHHYKIAFKRIVLPINYWRVTVFKCVVDHIINMDWDSAQDARILDVGSPKLLSLFLATRIGGLIFATDLQDKSIFSEWQKHYQHVSKRKNMVFEFADAKRLPYPDNHFDAVYSLSVIHMITPAEDGDMLALKEMQKKIKPGGVLIIEVPYRKAYTVNYANRNNFEEIFMGKPLFKERQYDDAALENRIESTISGSLLKRIILYERLPLDNTWNRLPKFVTTLLAFAEPWMDLLNISVAKNKRQLEKGKSAILIFEIECGHQKAKWLDCGSTG